MIGFEEFKELMEKKSWVEGAVNAAFCGAGCGIAKVNYRVFEHKTGYAQEYLEIIWRGGARSVRNCNWNSKGAILEEATKMIFGGYYAEVPDLVEIECSEDWKEIKENELTGGEE